ncbi:Growth-Arrest-Specific Protein 2 Domain [Teratosphaeria destructans]|uniref:Growth-Arrest-Specific Protein 2 Domain n=1 Tax=Teratosphaeria destructans TaxID=418781 RepID=A0A9W7SK60_9PEZI|nr:Growth-Arrest-Specific Protein 2 Domain [Teratosphaeria destructans]
MPLPNPTTNVPRLTSRPQRHARSPSHSPVRQALDYDPLLSDLTPTRTLHVFADHQHDGASTSSKHDSAIYHGVKGASPSERALGTRAAQTCITLRGWCHELESWEWPGTFDLPEPAKTRLRTSGAGERDMFMVPTSDGDAEEHWGSLAARTVQAYDRRVDEICRDLDTTDVEELKEYVLAAHQASGGGVDDSFTGLGRISDLRHLDDFTAIVTAIILQALPFLSRIHMLLDSWTIRLSILRQTPQYLRDLKYARMDLNQGWAAIAASYPASRATTFTPDMMHELQDAIQQQVKSLAQRLDGFLDELEGSAETLPESWIEDFEDLEAAYVDWVVQAERRIIENEWRSTAAIHENQRAARRESERALTDGSLERNSSDSYAREIPDFDVDALVSPSSRPTSVVYMLPHGERESVEPYVDAHASLYEGETAEAEEAGTLQQTGQAHVSHSQDRSSLYNSHLPTTDYDERSAEPPPPVGYNGSPDVFKALPPPPSMEPVEKEQTPPDNVGKMRAIFLSGEPEQPKSLRAQVKSPVRPFERATNAFTQLFRRDKTPELSRSSSIPSEGNRRINRRGKATQSQEIDPGTAFGALENGEIIERGQRDALQPAHGQPKRESWRLSSGSQQLEDRDRMQGAEHGHMSEDIKTYSRNEDPVHRARPLYTPEEDSEGEERQMSMVDRPRPETYKPTGLETQSRPQTSGHHQELEYPADWPLASPPATEPPSPLKEGRMNYSVARDEEYLSEDDFSLEPAIARQPKRELRDDKETDGERPHSDIEIKTPRPLRTNDFDRLFVHSFPAVTDAEEKAADESARPRRSVSRKHKKLREPIVGEAMLHDTFSLRSNDHLRKRASMSSLGAWEGRSRGTGIMEGRVPASAATRHNKGKNVEAESVQPLGVGPQWVPSKPSSSGALPKQDLRRKSMPAMAAGSLKLEIPGLKHDLAIVTPAPGAENFKPGHISRASITSIDSVPRSQVKTIELLRRKSEIYQSDSQTHPPWADNSNPVSPVDQHDSFPVMPYKGLVTFPSPPPGRISSQMSPVSPIAERDFDRILPPTSRFAAAPVDVHARNSIEESPSSPYTEPDDSPAPMHLHSAKRREPAESLKDRTPSKDAGDVFDRHVSEVLERLPSQSIRFKSGPGAEIPEPAGRTPELRSHRGVRPKTTRLGPRNEGSITIAPAEASSRKSESEVKLYHLTQADSDQPIKLFVRIVGEGERVMVRVGGGWQDLADFLRQFATHHGSRTASGGALEVITPDSSAPGSRKVSGSALPGTKTPGHNTTTGTPPAKAPVPRPMSRSDAKSGHDDDWLSQPQPVFSMGDDSRPTTADGSLDTFHLGSRPGTADSAKRPASAAGRRLVLDEHKSRWVDDMIEKARMSAEKSKEERLKCFGDLGRAGGTRRLVFRASSGADGPEQKKS